MAVATGVKHGLQDTVPDTEVVANNVAGMMDCAGVVGQIERSVQ